MFIDNRMVKDINFRMIKGTKVFKLTEDERWLFGKKYKYGRFLNNNIILGTTRKDCLNENTN
jgi:hypothetical protein